MIDSMPNSDEWQSGRVLACLAIDYGGPWDDKACRTRQKDTGAIYTGTSARARQVRATRRGGVE